MAHTNGTIPEFHHPRRQMERQREQLELTISQMEKYIRYLEGELSNVVEAVKQYGYVTLRDERGEGLVTLIERPEEIKSAEVRREQK
jgi:hypothetical protein